MKFSVILAVVGICCTIVAGQSKSPANTNPNKLDQKGVRVVYDKSRNETIVRSLVIEVRQVPGTIEGRFPEGTRVLPSETLEIMAHFSFPGKTFVKPAYVLISFLSLAQGEFKYSRDTEVMVMADTRRFDFGRVSIVDRRVDINMGTPFYRETVQVSVESEEFLQITNATKLKVRLGKVEFDLSASKIRSLRSLALQAGQ